MFKYAQIDIATGKCVGISFLSGEIQAGHMISIDDMNIEIGDFYLNGSWTRNKTNRIDDNTVEDVAYIFDIEIGDYVENTVIPRVTRNEHWDNPDGTFNLDKYKQVKINTLSAIAEGELNTFQSSALGTPHTYLIGQDSKGRDYMTLFSGQFSYITSSYYDPAKPIIWYTVESGNIVHSKDEFAQVFLDARDHVGNVKYKLADLEVQINAPSVTTKPQVDAFVW